MAAREIISRQNLPGDIEKTWLLPLTAKKEWFCHEPLQKYGHLLLDAIALII